MIGQQALEPFPLEVVKVKAGVWHRAEGLTDEWGNERTRCGVNIGRWGEVGRLPVTEAEAIGMVSCRRCRDLHLGDLPQVLL